MEKQGKQLVYWKHFDAEPRILVFLTLLSLAQLRVKIK